MSTNTTSIRTGIAHTAVVATATCAAALTWAGPASAERKTVVYDYVMSHCRAADDCDMVQMPFEVETGSQTVLLSNVPGNPGNDCAKAVAEFWLGGQRLLSRLVHLQHKVGARRKIPRLNHRAVPRQLQLGRDPLRPVPVGAVVADKEIALRGHRPTAPPPCAS